MSLVIVWCSIFSFHVSALTEEMPACSVKGDPHCQVDAKFADWSVDELGVQFVQKKSLSKRSQNLQATTTAASPGWYSSGVDQSCTTGCAAVGLQCFESQQQANNGDVDTTAEVKTLIGQVGGSTNAWVCLQPHGHNPDVPSFGPFYCFVSNSSRELSSFDCDQVPVPANQSKQRLCYCANFEAEALTTTAAAAAAPTTTAAAGGPQSTECSAMIQPMFDQLDANKDGVGTKAELRTMLEGMGVATDESVDGQWALMDVNGDGVTTCAEMESSIMR